MRTAASTSAGSMGGGDAGAAEAPGGTAAGDGAAPPAQPRLSHQSVAFNTVAKLTQSR